MKDTCWKPFGFLVMDHREAQEFLNSMAAQGWEMADFRFGMLKFRRTERTDLRYFIDWTDPRKGEEEDYLQLCEEAGWELRESLEKSVNRPERRERAANWLELSATLAVLLVALSAAMAFFRLA